MVKRLRRAACNREVWRRNTIKGGRLRRPKTDVSSIDWHAELVTETAQHEQPLVLGLEAWTSTDVKIRVNRHHGRDMISLLRTEGVEASYGAEFSNGPAYELVVATISNEAFWISLGVAVRAWLKARSGRKIRIKTKGLELTADGYAADDVVRILESVRVHHGEVVAKVERTNPKAVEGGDVAPR
ncbi:effector-associated constant component EACC1 [Actinosynnema sp. CA-299493]